jgi:hypothetical protein
MKKLGLGAQENLRSRLPLVTAALCGLLVALTSDTALAAREQFTVYESSFNCQDTTSVWETDSGTPDGFGYAEGHSYSTKNILSSNCSVRFDRPPNHHAVWLIVYKWNGSQWGECYNTNGHYYNATETYIFKLIHNMGFVPDCGEGYYGTVAYSWHLNGNWVPETHFGVWSGYEYHR